MLALSIRARDRVVISVGHANAHLLSASTASKHGPPIIHDAHLSLKRSRSLHVPLATTLFAFLCHNLLLALFLNMRLYSSMIVQCILLPFKPVLLFEPLLKVELLLFLLMLVTVSMCFLIDTPYEVTEIIDCIELSICALLSLFRNFADEICVDYK